MSGGSTTFINDEQSPTNIRYDFAQFLAAKILYELGLDRNEKLVDWLAEVDNPKKVRNIGELLKKQRLK